MPLGTQNITADFRERQYAAYHDQSEPPSWFRHRAATYTGPTAIVFPGTLTAREQVETRMWLAATPDERPNTLLRCTQRASIAKITEYIAYYADLTYLAWRDADNAARVAQWRLFLADALIQSKVTEPVSADITGVGDAAITPPITQTSNMID